MTQQIISFEHCVNYFVLYITSSPRKYRDYAAYRRYGRTYGRNPRFQPLLEYDEAQLSPQTR